MIENIDELQELLEEILPSGFSLVKNKQGKIIIHTKLFEKENGNLVSFDNEDEEKDFDEDDEGVDDLHEFDDIIDDEE